MRYARYHKASGHILAIVEGDLPSGYALDDSISFGTLAVDPGVSASTHWINRQQSNNIILRAREEMPQAFTKATAATANVSTRIADAVPAELYVRIRGSGSTQFNPAFFAAGIGGLMVSLAAGDYVVDPVGRYLFDPWSIVVT